jgi:hypothetical protein
MPAKPTRSHARSTLASAGVAFVSISTAKTEMLVYIIHAATDSAIVAVAQVRAARGILNGVRM